MSRKFDFLTIAFHFKQPSNLLAHRWIKNSSRGGKNARSSSTPRRLHLAVFFIIGNPRDVRTQTLKRKNFERGKFGSRDCLATQQHSQGSRDYHHIWRVEMIYGNTSKARCCCEHCHNVFQLAFQLCQKNGEFWWILCRCEAVWKIISVFIQLKEFFVILREWKLQNWRVTVKIWRI